MVQDAELKRRQLKHLNEADGPVFKIARDPRITRIAGFEWGSGFYINPTPPEEAARFLREVNT